MVALERSPFFPEILLGVTDWAFYLWKDGLQTHFFQSPSPQNYFTAGAWSPTRPSVLSAAGRGGRDRSAPPPPRQHTACRFWEGKVVVTQLLSMALGMV